MSGPAPTIAANLERLRDQVADACARAGRSCSSVALMAVSKMHPTEAILEACAAGQRLFGENRVQEFAAKSSALSSSGPWNLDPDPCIFHLIGPLQNNKTAERLSSAAQTLGKRLEVLVEVKLSPEETKHGLAPQELPALLAALAPLPHLDVRGLMTVPPWSEDPETVRPFFQQLRRLRDENLAAYPTLTELSMGMSNDFAVAIEEGSTCVRIGTAIFGKRIYS